MSSSDAAALREQRGWYFYDWANSAFTTTVVSVLLGPYLTSLAKNAADSNGDVRILGASLAVESIWPYAVSASVLTQVFALPIFGAFADYGRRKKEMLGTLAYIGSAATIGMFFLDGSRWLAGVVLFLIANFAFGASIVVYNSFLPEIAPPDDRDRVSSKGWGLGFLGGGLLLAMNLAVFSRASDLGISEAMAVRIGLASAGLWWGGFTLIPLLRLRNRIPSRRPVEGMGPLQAAFRQLGHTLREIRHYPQTLLFLAAYLIYNDAIQTVITMAVQFGSQELKLPVSDLTAAILMVQFVAFGGALAFNRIAATIGAKTSVMVALVVWAAALVYIYLAVYSRIEFFVAAAIIATVLGGSQALSRSLFSLMIPQGREAEYFAVYEISDKGTSWLGPLFFGLTFQITRSLRLAVLSLIVFFVIGLVLLARVDIRRAAEEAGNPMLSRRGGL
jgi:UMF1 family MFS transporter